MKLLTLSVIIPAYNEETYLKACLTALSTQTVMPDEVIVVDNNSTDKTAQIAKSFSFVRLITEKKQGLYFSRNAGMNAAKGEILARIDADTIVQPGWAAAIKDGFTDPTVHAASGPIGYHDTPFSNLTVSGMSMFLKVARMGKYHFLMGANMVLRRSAWEMIKDDLCNHPTLFEDIDIAIHLKQHGITSVFLEGMRAFVSSRRMADTPQNFLRYIGGHTRTFEHHGMRAPAAYYAEGAYTLFYFGYKPFHMMFDPKLRRPSLTYFLNREQARPDPMHVK